MTIFIRMKQYLHSYPLPPGISHADAGRILLQRYRENQNICFVASIYILRLPMENALCTTKTVIWIRRHLFSVPTAAELQRGRGGLRLVNLMDQQQTNLPTFDLAHLNCVAGGPYQVKLANGYITSVQVRQSHNLDSSNN